VNAYVLRHSNGTYFRKWVNGFGPMFGATLAETKRFETRADAASWLADWRMSGGKVEKVKPRGRA